MLNSRHHSIGSAQSRRRSAFIMLAFFFGCLTLAPFAQAQEGVDDPVTGVEVTIGDPSGSSSGSVQSNAVTVTAPKFVWRDAVATVSGKIHCYDDEGDATPYATVSSITMSGPGSVSPTSGTTDKNGDLAITIHSTDISTDDATGTVTATSNSVNGSGSVSFKGALQIKNGNTDVTHASTNSMIGEQQSLAVSLRSGVQISSATWTFGGGGTPIANWQQSDPNKPSASLTTLIPPSGLTGTSASFYVTTTGTATVKVSVTDSGGSGNGATSVNVSMPTFTFTAAQAVPVVRTLEIALGSFDASSPGIQFTGSGGSGGTLSAAQIVTMDGMEVTTSSGVQPIDYPDVPGLDNTFPYSLVSGGSPADSPNTTFAKGVTEVNKAFVAIMYLMWQSSKKSVPVHVESVSWDWEVDVKFDLNTGKPLPSYTHSEAKPSLKATPISGGVLDWTQTVKNK